ncbi:MAG: lipase family protein [Cyanophyceae cyanobacterium]
MNFLNKTKNKDQAKIHSRFSGLSQTRSYDAKTALSLAIACDLAYEKRDKEIKRTVESWGFKLEGVAHVAKKPDIDTQCYVMSDDISVVVVFRGSDSLKDWLANFQSVYDPGPLDNTRVHEGFQDALFPAAVPITKLLNQALTTGDKKIWITGHSLGGALCSLYAGMLTENAREVYGVYTFGSPRPGNGAFEEQLNDKLKEGPHFRVINSGDVVPHVPPEPFYSHPGERVILKETSITHSSDSWFNQRVEALKVFIKNTSNLLEIGDNHKISGDSESYISRLIKDVERSENHDQH